MNCLMLMIFPELRRYQSLLYHAGPDILKNQVPVSIRQLYHPDANITPLPTCQEKNQKRKQLLPAGTRDLTKVYAFLGAREVDLTRGVNSRMMGGSVVARLLANYPSLVWVKDVCNGRGEIMKW